MLPEDALVSAIARAVGPPSGGVALGIGDDGAVLDDGTVASTDVLVEGVHFDLARMTPRDVGHRAAAANLSDLAAMGARPVALLAAFGLPPGFEDAAEIAAGMSEHGVPIAGGDLSRAPVLIVSVTAIGLGRCGSTCGLGATTGVAWLRTFAGDPPSFSLGFCCSRCCCGGGGGGGGGSGALTSNILRALCGSARSIFPDICRNANSSAAWIAATNAIAPLLSRLLRSDRYIRSV